MAGYVGERARRRKRRIIFIVFLTIISLTIIYFSYTVDDQKIEINNIIDATDSTVENEQLSIDKEEFELKIIEQEQKIVFRDQRIKSLKKQINVLKEEKNNLSEKSEKLLVSLDALNSEIEKNSQDKKDAVKEKVKEFNLVILQLKKKNEKILNEYENVVKKNLELDLQLNSLNMEVNSLNMEIKSLNIEKMEIKSLNIEKMGKISQLEQVINEQKEIIKSLKDNNPH